MNGSDGQTGENGKPGNTGPQVFGSFLYNTSIYPYLFLQGIRGDRGFPGNIGKMVCCVCIY